MRRLLGFLILFIILIAIFLYAGGREKVPKIRQYFLRATPTPTEMPLEEITISPIVPTTTPTPEAPAAEGQLPASGIKGD